MSVETYYIELPNRAEAQKIQNVIKEIDNALMMIESKKDFIKDAKDVLKNEYKMTPKSISTLIKLYHTQAAKRHFMEQEELQSLYDLIFNQEDGE